jgi:L-fucose mutarotase/ribose pyranase (RbsD/FucU family)
MKCFIYRNLHKKGYTYSIKALDGPHKGLVVGYGGRIVVKDVEFKVSEAGRRRCIRERKKNVHAGIVGELVSVYDLEERIPAGIVRDLNYWREDSTEVTYNPYKTNTFIAKKTGQPVFFATSVHFWGALVEAYGVVTSATPVQHPVV